MTQDKQDTFILVHILDLLMINTGLYGCRVFTFIATVVTGAIKKAKRLTSLKNFGHVFYNCQFTYKFVF